MGYVCRICHINEVHRPGDICDLCLLTGRDAEQDVSRGDDRKWAEPHSGRRIWIGGESPREELTVAGETVAAVPQMADTLPADPYAQGTQTDLNPNATAQGGPANNGPVIQAAGAAASGAASSSGQNYIARGIAKNINEDLNDHHGFLFKWFRSFFTGLPYSPADDMLMFQLYPDMTGMALNAMGNACDQVIVYGKINKGAVSENNEIEVTGYRDSNNNVVATMIRNVASGTIIRPRRSIPAGIVRIITGVVLAAMFILPSIAGLL